VELFSPEFFSALAAIIIIDLVLAGDNAIVIALAARGLPGHLARRAILWGTFGAIAVRSAMTLVVVWLLKIPGLLFLGGLALVWIGYKLLAPQKEEGPDSHRQSATSFWAAMKTIIVADAVMGLDNVMAVAGAAHGSFLLVVLGLLISIPIVIWGSQLILKFVERYPAIVYVGGAVLAWTAAKMMVSEPLARGFFEGRPGLAWALYLLVPATVIGAGLFANHAKIRGRIARHLVDIVGLPVRTAEAGGEASVKLLVPVDGSDYALQAVRLVMNRALDRTGVELHLVHVRTPLKQYVGRFFGRRDRDAWHRMEAEREMSRARALLEGRGIPYVAHVELGEKAEMINRVARRVRADRIVMGTARKNSLTRLIEDSVTHRVLETTEIPVEVIPGESVSLMERAGVATAVVAVMAWLLIAV